MEAAPPDPTRPRRVRLVPLLIAAAVVAIVATAALTVRSLARVADARAALNEARVVEGALHTLLTGMLDADSGQRGFLIARQIDYLEPYFAALARVQAGRMALGVALVDDAWARSPLETLDSTIEAKLAELEESVALIAAGKHAEAARIVREGPGRRLMDRIRHLTNEIALTEQRIQQTRAAEHAREVRYAYATITGSFLLNMALLCALALTTRRRSVEQVRAADALHARNDELSRLLQVTARQRENGEALADLSGHLQSCANMDEAIELMQTRLPQVLAARRGALYLFAASRNQLRKAFQWGDHSFTELLAPGECLALRHGQAYRQPPGDGNAGCQHLQDTPAPLRATLECLPVVAHGELMGMLVADCEGEAGDGLAQTRRSVLEHLALSVGNIMLRESLRQQSIRDPLTGLFNRRFLDESAERELLRAARARELGIRCGVAILMIDIDHFKSFNDDYGHEAGDQVLREVARILQQFTRGSDVAARYGGEEFTVLMPDIDSALALERAEQLCDQVESQLLRSSATADGARGVTISIGVACHPSDAVHYSGLLAIADRRLYAAKRAGRNRVSGCDT